MKFQDLIIQIQTEARVKGDDSFVPAIMGILNELFKEATQSQKPFELRREVSLTLTAATPIVALPADFFIHNQVRFTDVDTQREYALVHQDQAIPPAPKGLSGHPTSFEILGGLVSIKPASEIKSGDQLQLVYYAIPPVITADNLTTDNPIPRLEPYLIRGAITRMRIVHVDDPTAVQALTPMASAGGSAFAKDEPRRAS